MTIYIHILSIEALFSRMEEVPLKERDNFLRKNLEKCKKSKLKNLAQEARLKIRECDIEQKPLLEMVIDFFLSKTTSKSPSKKSRKKSKFICPIKYLNKGMDFIRIQQFFKSEDVINTLPEELQSEDPPSVVYSLGNTIRNKILNYKETVAGIDINDKHTFGTRIAECNCQNSSFKNEHLGHVVTGDLRIISNQRLRKLISKGPNYREPCTINWNKCRSEIERGLDECAVQLSKHKRSISLNHLIPWKRKVLEKVDHKIQELRQRITHRTTNPVLKDPEVKRNLEALQTDYVIVPIDKASNNIAVVCKKFYVEVLLKEIGILGPESNTYTAANKSMDEIIFDNILYQNHVAMDVDEKEKTLPSMYWLPKMHKTPVGNRFIIASKFCSTKPLSRNLSTIFKLLYNQIQNYNTKEKYLSNYNMFWVLDNIDPIINKLEKIRQCPSLPLILAPYTLKYLMMNYLVI